MSQHPRGALVRLPCTFRCDVTVCPLHPIDPQRGRLYFDRCICNGRSEATWGQGHAAYCLHIRSLYFGCCKSNGLSKVIWDERARCLLALPGRLLCYQCTQLIFVLADETDDACVFLQQTSHVSGIQPGRYVGGKWQLGQDRHGLQCRNRRAPASSQGAQVYSCVI